MGAPPRRGPVFIRRVYRIRSTREVVSTVDGVRLAGNPGGRVRAQEQRHVGHIVGLAESADDVARDVRLGLFAGEKLRLLRLFQRRLEGRQGNGVGGNAVAAGFPRQGANETGGTALGGGVGGEAIFADAASVGHHRHDAASAGLDHARHQDVAAVHDTVQVGLEELAPIVGGRFPEGR